MELLIVLLLAPSVILAQRYQTNGRLSSSNPNDEPFLPIYPLYPYNPKLIKRGTERDVSGHLTPELYAPKLDARDSYTASFAGNYQRDPYYPSYNPYPKSSTTGNYATSTSLPSAAYSAESYPSGTSFSQPNAYGTVNSAYNAPTTGYTNPNTYSPYPAASYSNPYPYSQAPYGVYNSYSPPYAGGPNPYQANPYATGAYPNYNYQAPYYYPNYYNHPYPAPPPPPPSHHNSQEGSSSDEDSSSENETTGKSSTKKTETRRNKYKEESDNSAEAKDEHFVDGGNYLSSGSKDLDGQPSTYKTPSPYNQVGQLSDVHLRSLPVPGVPTTTYRVISVGGQPVGPDYPLPTNYAKVQQLEQLMSQALAKLLAQNTGNQAGQFQYQSGQQADSFEGQGAGNKQAQQVIAKTGLAYVMNPSNLGKIAGNPGQYFNGFGNRQNPVVIKVQETSNQGSTVLTKAGTKYPDGPFGQKTVTTVSLQQAPGIYIPPEAKTEKDDDPPQPSEYSDYDAQPAQSSYDGPISPNGGYKKNEQNYSLDQGQGNLPYHSSNLVTVQTPQAQSYQYSSYLPTQSTQQQQQPRDYKTSLDDVNFSTKRNSKA